MMVRFARAATAAAITLALIGLGTGSATAADVPIPPPPDSLTDGWVAQVDVTDGAVYLATGTFEPYAGDWSTTIWRRTLHPGADGIVVGNNQLVGHAEPSPSGVVFAATDDGIVYRERATGRLVRYDDTGTATFLSAGLVPSLTSVADAWYTTEDSLRPLPDPRPGATGGLLLGRSDATWPFADATVSLDGTSPATSDAVVAWIETAWADVPPYGRAYRLLANPLDPTGFVGDPVVLDENLGDGSLAPAQVLVSDELLVWVSQDHSGGHSVLRWVPPDDLTAAPQERVLGSSTTHFVLDGTRVAFSEWNLSSQWSTVVDLADGTAVTVPQTYWESGLRGDLLARSVWMGNEQLRTVLTSLSGAPLSAAPSFTDVSPTSPFVEHIDRLAIAGITTGYPDGTFRPAAPVTREAMAAFLYRQAGEPAFTPPAASPFADVWPGHPFYAAICWLAAEGISTGWDMGDGTRQFRPGDPVSREAMAAFLYRRAGEPAFTPPLTPPFTDVTTAHPFYDEIAWLASVGVTTGWRTGSTAQFRPGLSIERQAMAAFLVRFGDLA